MKATKQNTADHYILHVYKHEKSERNKHLTNLRSRVDFSIGTAFGNFLIDCKDCFTDEGSEDLRYEYVGYGCVKFMGQSIYFPEAKNMYGLFYKNIETKQAVEIFIKLIDQLNSDRTESIKYIHHQHGRPKIDHAVLYAQA